MNIKKELPTLFIVLLPFIYLAYIWNQLPEKVPMHWNAKGEIDRYGDKIELLMIPFMLPVLTYLIFLVVPKIDPKNKIKQMGKKYDSLKWILTAFMSVLALFIIYSAKNSSLSNPNFVFILVGLLFSTLGNYFKTIKANYFIGIRTPWTLENETVWKDTHKLGGVLWFWGGIGIVLSGIIFSSKISFIILVCITAIISIIPIVYSYFRFKKITK